MPTIISPNDGVYYVSAGSYFAARDATGATSGASNSTGWYYQYINNYMNFRSFHAFDTSGISVVPASATISFYCYAGGSSHNTRLVKSTAPVDLITATTNASYNDIVGFVAGASMAGNVTDYSTTNTAWVNYQFATYTLTAAALSDMASQNVLSVCLVNYDYDYLRAAPSNVGPISGYYSGNADASLRPKLDYVEGTPGYSQDVLGVGQANIDAVEGVATADIEAVLGVS